MPEVRQILSEAGDLATLAGRVPQSEAPIHLAASDILVSPHVPNPDGTEFFGSPTKLFEYMVMGKGIVASRLGQIETVLQPAVDVDELPATAPPGDEARVAVLVRPGNDDDLGKALRFLVERKDWRNSLGSNARSRALAKFTWSHHVEAILGAIQRQSARSRPGSTLNQLEENNGNTTSKRNRVEGDRRSGA